MSLGDIFAEMVVTIAARYGNCNGHLILYRRTDTLYTVEFKDCDEKVLIQSDIDSVHIDIKSALVRIFEPGPDGDVDASFEIPDRRHLQIFHDAQRECQEICNMTLELITRLRDVYYAGVFRSVDAGSEAVVSERMRELQEIAKQSFLRRVSAAKPKHHSQSSRRRRKVNNHMMEIAPKQVESDDDPVGGELITEDGPVRCFYCKQQSDDSTTHYVHPFVPRDFSQHPIFMCNICIDNWKLYRDDALYESRLVLPGEVNEEVRLTISIQTISTA